MTMMLGLLVLICALVWLWLISFFNTAKQQVVAPAILVGIGNPVLIVTALAMGTELIGPHTVSVRLPPQYFLHDC